MKALEGAELMAVGQGSKSRVGLTLVGRLTRCLRMCPSPSFVELKFTRIPQLIILIICFANLLCPRVPHVDR